MYKAKLRPEQLHTINIIKEGRVIVGRVIGVSSARVILAAMTGMRRDDVDSGYKSTYIYCPLHKCLQVQICPVYLVPKMNGGGGLCEVKDHPVSIVFNSFKAQANKETYSKMGRSSADRESSSSVDIN